MQTHILEYHARIVRDISFHSLELIFKLKLYFRGDVVTMDCVENVIKKDWIHPLTGEKLKEEDIIPLQRVISNIFPSNCIFTSRSGNHPKHFCFLLRRVELDTH